MIDYEVEMERKNIINWDARVKNASKQYSGFDNVTPALFDTIIENIGLWANILPQTQMQGNCYQPVNSWGLSCEKTEIEAIIDELLLEHKIQVAQCLKERFGKLEKIACTLDNLYPILSDTDKCTEERLVLLCQRRASLLQRYLKQITPQFFNKRDTIKRTSIQYPIIQVQNPQKTLSWNDIEIKFMDGHTISVKCNNKSQILSYGDLQMANKNNASPTKQWLLLQSFADNKGMLSWKNSDAHVDIKKRKQLLSKNLKDHFKIDDEPIVWDKKLRCYKCIFLIRNYV